MWRARFPWTPPVLSTRAPSPVPIPVVPLSSLHNCAAYEDIVPEGLTVADQLLFRRVGGFGSGRELIVNDASAVVHAISYISALQCEISWRDNGAMSPVSKDAQFIFRPLLKSLSTFSAGEDLASQIYQEFISICSAFRDGIFDPPSVGWR